MIAGGRSFSVEQVQDLDRVARLWRELGHPPCSVRSYQYWTLQVLAAAHVSDYRELSADRVVLLARSFALKHHHRSPHRTRRHWLAAFRAFAWGLQRLGKAVGSVNLVPRTQEADPVIAAFVEYGQKLGWAEHTLEIRQLYLGHLRRYLVQRQSPWPVPRLIDLDHFLHRAAKDWKRTTVSGAAGAFRFWLRFLFVTGRTEHDLASSVALPPSIAFPQPARALPWSMVRQLGRGIDRSTPWAVATMRSSFCYVPMD